ncbi:MAG: hypothetical protein ACOYOE_13925 [Chlorobium sp.]
MIILCSNAGLRGPQFSLTDGFVVTIWRKKSALCAGRAYGGGQHWSMLTSG